MKEASSAQLVRRVKSGDWRAALPMVAGLVQPEAGAIPVSLHVTKKDGFPVRIDPDASAAVAFLYVKPEDKYPYLTSELAQKLGISTSQLCVAKRSTASRTNCANSARVMPSTIWAQSSFSQTRSRKAFESITNAIDDATKNRSCALTSKKADASDR